LKGFSSWYGRLSRRAAGSSTPLLDGAPEAMKGDMKGDEWWRQTPPGGA